MATTKKAAWILAAGAAIALYLYVKNKGLMNTSAALANAAADAVGQVALGTVYGVADAVGIPRTDPALCAAAKASGNTLDASLYCPAIPFIQYGLGSRQTLPEQGASLEKSGYLDTGGFMGP
jgi:hypothetical protein